MAASPASRRAALRQQQQAAEQAQRAKRIMYAAVGIAALVVVIVVAMVALQMSNRDQVAGEQLAPPNASQGNGIYIQGQPEVDGTPHVVVWGDYQCGGCAAFDEMYGPVINELVLSGDITAEIRQAHFLDGQASGGPSLRASVAAAAADEAGYFDAYHHALYANQQSRFTEQALREEIPAAVGISGEALSTFQNHYDSLAFEEWADDAHQRFVGDEVNSTPSYFVDDKPLVLYDFDNDAMLVEPEAGAFLSAVNELASS